MEAGYARNIEDESQNPEKGCLTFIDRFRLMISSETVKLWSGLILVMCLLNG